MRPFAYVFSHAGQYTPTVVASASSWNGRTPLTPSQGYLMYGCFALALVALEEAGHEELLGQGGQLHAAGLAVADDLVGVVEIDDSRSRPAAAGRSR